VDNVGRRHNVVNGDTLIIVNILERCSTRERERERRRGKVVLVLLDLASQTIRDLRVEVKVCSIGLLGVEVCSNVFIERVLCAENQCVVSEGVARVFIFGKQGVFCGHGIEQAL
jgi:hypothetical protein